MALKRFSFFLKNVFIVLKDKETYSIERKGEEEKLFFNRFTLRIVTTAKSDPGQNKELGNTPGPFTG